ncbi:MAG: hypothetical protein ACFFD4_34040 [Candidatus Odinarchaeota archaeon]
MEYLHYALHSETLCAGERIKKGTFRPATETIPYSQITGALKAQFNTDAEIHAVGTITSYDNRDYLTFSPRDRVTGVSKIPLTIEFLVNVKGNVYIVKSKNTEIFPPVIHLRLGGMKTKGFGSTKLTKKAPIVIAGKDQLETGELNTRIPVEYLDKFLVETIRPRYGYLPRLLPDSSVEHIISLFEGSEVKAPVFLVRRGE